VAWDVEVTNQDKEPVAIYTILTLVRRKVEANDPDANDPPAKLADNPRAPAAER
jgi:oxepin-CoA hydrolase/3-oxo-5,6-dehydrosuberyl-CoA semialdehyde dehydrogenase